MENLLHFATAFTDSSSNSRATAPDFSITVVLDDKWSIDGYPSLTVDETAKRTNTLLLQLAQIQVNDDDQVQKSHTARGNHMSLSARNMHENALNDDGNTDTELLPTSLSFEIDFGHPVEMAHVQLVSSARVIELAADNEHIGTKRGIEPKAETSPTMGIKDSDTGTQSDISGLHQRCAVFENIRPARKLRFRMVRFLEAGHLHIFSLTLQGRKVAGLPMTQSFDVTQVRRRLADTALTESARSLMTTIEHQQSSAIQPQSGTSSQNNDVKSPNLSQVLQLAQQVIPVGATPSTASPMSSLMAAMNIISASKPQASALQKNVVESQTPPELPLIKDTKTPTDNADLDGGSEFKDFQRHVETRLQSLEGKVDRIMEMMEILIARKPTPTIG